MTPEGRREIRADLVVGADGRHSVVRAEAGLEVLAFGAPMDVLWFRLSRRGASRLPLALRFLRRFAVLRRIPARLIGIGVRPEHAKSPAVSG